MSKNSTHKKVESTDYTEFTTVEGKVLHIFTPPLELIASITPPREKPLQPTVEMELASGDTQTRFAKKGDPGWDKYQTDLDDWGQEKLDLQEAAKFVTALQDFQFPDPLTFPVHTQEMIDAELLTVPANIYLKKMMWLRAAVLLSQNDEVEIDFVIQVRSGVPEEMIDQIKENFRSHFRESVSEEVGIPSAKSEASEGVQLQPDVSNSNSS